MHRDLKIAEYISEIISIEEKRVKEFDYMETKITKNEYRAIVKALEHHKLCTTCLTQEASG